jgi:tRNA-specific 2-thiouridylase
MGKKVLIAVSGGIDSSSAMVLLKERQYDVAALHMKMWEYPEDIAPRDRREAEAAEESIRDLHEVCRYYSIPFNIVDVRQEFRAAVIDNFVSEYMSGRTPNPCVVCNVRIKWKTLLEKAAENGCEYVATGHYARVEYNNETARYVLKKGIDGSRDQSYALWNLSQEALSKTVLPLGDCRKSEIRAMALKLGLRTAHKDESQDICFVADNDYRRFILARAGQYEKEIRPGNVIDRRGTIIGRHRGIPFYTIGQRKGLGIAAPGPLYVQKIMTDSNTLVVGEDSDLYAERIAVRDINWISIPNLSGELNAEVKIRYLHHPAAAVVVPVSGSRAEVIFRENQRAATPGQSAVFYDGDIVLGGGIIESVKN